MAACPKYFAANSQELRRLPPFDVANGGRSLCHDGFHMSYDYGRYAVACTWLAAALPDSPEQIRDQLEKFINRFQEEADSDDI